LTRQVAASVPVPHAGGAYPVLIGSGLVDRLDEIVAKWTPLEAELFATVLEHLVAKLRPES